MSGWDVAHLSADLENDLAVVCVPLPASHTAAVTMLVRAGPRFESIETNGISHFLEHMVYRGSPSHASAHEQALAFERLGGTLYAATHTDHGVMSLSLPVESLEAAIPLFAEVVHAPRFTAIEIERGIVREEILEDLDDEGRQVDADNICRSVMYGDHPLGFTITGPLSQVDRFDEEMLREQHARHYTGRNAVLAFAGAIDPERCLDMARRTFGILPRGLRVEPSPPPVDQKKARFRYVRNLSSQTALRFAFRAVADRDPREPAIEMLLRILDDGMSTRLYGRICDAKGLCYDVGALYESYEDDGVLDIAAEVQHGRAATVSEEIFHILSEIAEHGPTEDEVDKARARHGWELRGMFDDADSVSGFFALARFARIELTPRARHDQIANVSRQQIRDAADWLFRPERLSVVAVGALSVPQKKELLGTVRAFEQRFASR